MNMKLPIIAASVCLATACVSVLPEPEAPEALYRVEANNLTRTLDHLELARLRNYVGYSGRDEVLRLPKAVR